MIALIAFFGTLWGRVAVAGGFLAALIAAWVGFAIHYEHKGAAAVIQKSKLEGQKINEKNRSITDRAREPGAFDRLRKDSCRDC
jgi:hypothetical protein